MKNLFKFFKEKVSSFVTKFVKEIKEKEIRFDDVKEILSEFELNLIEADCSPEVAERIKKELAEKLIGKRIVRNKAKQKIVEIIKNEVKEMARIEKIDIKKVIEKAKREKKVATFLFFGINGVGKSLSIAKFANYLKKMGYKPILAAGDTFREAGDIQLEEYASKIKLPVIKHKRGGDSAAVIYDAKEAAIARKFDLVIADTSGRMHTKKNLIDELKKIVRVNKPDLKILVLDSLSGSDVINQFKFFDKAVGIDAVVFTKVDVDEKGGNILSICYFYKKPILFLGTGQGFEDLEEFDFEKFASNLMPH